MNRTATGCEAPQRHGFRPGRRIVPAPALLLLLWGLRAAAVQLAPPRIRRETGVTRLAAVPMVSESWYATLSRPAPRRLQPSRFIGFYPGYGRAKRRANEIAAKQRPAPARTANAAGSLARRLAQANGSAATAASPEFIGPTEQDAQAFPPDSQVAAGPLQAVVAINNILAIYNRDGSPAGSYQPLSTFFSTLVSNGFISDPRVIYDQADGRFILSAINVDFNNSTANLLLAVSATSDATGTWNKFAIASVGLTSDGTKDTFPDFPTLGLSASAIYISTGQFAINLTCLQNGGCSFSDTWITVIGLPELLAGNSTLNITTFKNVQNAAGQAAFVIQPAVTYGAAPAEFLAAANFSSNDNNQLDLFSITTGGTPVLTAAELSLPVNYALPPDAAQPGSQVDILTNDFRILNAVWSNGSLWCAQNTADASGAYPVARWYQIAISDLASASLTQSGTVNGSGEAYYPAISATAAGSALIAFTTSSPTIYASAAFTGREAADAAGAMRSFGLLHLGADYYDHTPAPNRWGDYSGASLDPDGASFWAMAEWAGTPNPNFETAIAHLDGPPEIAASPGALDFGNVLVGKTAPAQTVTLTNLSADSVAMGQLSIQGQDYAISADTCSNATLNPAATCSLAVGFTPSVNQLENTFLSIPYTGQGGVLTVGLTGTGIIQAALSFTPATLSFSPTPQQGASTLTAQLTNSGNIAADNLVWSAPLNFTSTNNCGSSLAAGASCQLTVTFRPTYATNYNGIFEVSSAGTMVQGTLPVSGTGISLPEALYCPTALNFPAQMVNTSSAPQTVILTNSGSDPLTVTAITSSGAFSQTSNCLTSLPPLGSCTIQATFTPTTTGALSGVISVYDDAAGSPQQIALSGSATSSAAANAAGGVAPAPSRVLHLASLSSGGAASGSGRRAVSNSAAAHRTRNKRLRRALANLPLYFEPNRGQFSRGVSFAARLPQYQLALSPAGLMLALPSKAKTARIVRLNFVGANRNAQMRGRKPLPGRVNYFLGRDPKDWHAGIPTYAQVEMRRIYPGIDLVYYGRRRRLEYDFRLAAGADPRQIAFRLGGGPSARLSLDPRGDLQIATAAGELRFRKPVIYQRTGRRRRMVPGGYRLLSRNRVGFRLGRYDRQRPLVIDPVLVFSTYLGGSGQDEASAIAVDAAGNAYIAGYTNSTDFPTTSGAFLNTCSSCSSAYDSFLAFVAKLSADGTQLIYATYLGSNSNPALTVASGIAVNAAGDAYIAGSTSDANFPVTTGALESTLACQCEAGFATELNPTGSALVYSTFVGGAGGNQPASNLRSNAHAITLDSAGDAYITGNTSNPSFPVTAGAFQTTNPSPGQDSGFLTKLNPAGTGAVFSTYIGGSGLDFLNAIALDSSGNVYVAGSSTSLDFPATAGAYQTGSYGNTGVIAKFTPGGTLVFASYLSGTRGGGISALAVDGSGAAYVTGIAAGALSSSAVNAQYAPFIAKLHPAGCALLAADYPPLSNAGIYDAGTGIAVDPAGDIFFAGNATEGNMESKYAGIHALQPAMSDNPDFIGEYDPSGQELKFFTPLGGSYSVDEIHGIALGPQGDLYVTGRTSAFDFPLAPANAFQSDPPMDSTGAATFVARINPGPASGVFLTRHTLTWPTLPMYDNEALAIGLENNQATALNISSLTLGGSDDFTLVDMSKFPNPPPACSGSIAPGTGCAVFLNFSPTSLGPIQGTLTIADDGAGSPRTIALNGAGEQDFSLQTSGPALSIMPGQTAQFWISAKMPPGAPNNLTITLACSNLAPATCSFNPTTITTNSGSSTTLTVGNVPAGGVKFQVTGTSGTQSSTVPLEVDIEDFTMTGNPTSASISPGQTASYTLNITALNGLTGDVNMSCTGAPSEAVCSVNPSPVSLTAGNSTVSATVNITTTAPTGLAPWGKPQPPPRKWPSPRMLAWCLGFGLALWLALRRRKALAVAGLTLSLVWLLSCGGGSPSGGGGGGYHDPGTPAGTYTLTLTGVIGSASHSVQLTLVVN